jgi:hypothetical protein
MKLPKFSRSNPFASIEKEFLEEASREEALKKAQQEAELRTK